MTQGAPPGRRRWRDLFDRVILEWPRTSLAALGLLLAVSAYGLKGFRIDASGDAFVLENDADVRYYRKLIERYSSGDFLVITYSPPEDLFSRPSLDRLSRLRDELKKLPRVSSVVTILDVPLLRNRPGTLKDLKDNIRTLESKTVDLPRAIREFRESPIYRHLLVSEDLRSSAVQVNFETDTSRDAMLARRSILRDKKQEGLSAGERREWERLQLEYRAYKDEVAAARHEDIRRIRAITARYSREAGIILGGVPMIVDDIITYVRKDLRAFGAGMVAILAATLWLIFRRLRWVVLPLACCVASVLVMMGILGIMRWDVTVVSSNFVSLQLILTLALLIHLVGRYSELLNLRPDAPNRELVREAVGDVFGPALHCQLTTVVGFASLVTCDILPIVNFGWMMSAGLLVSMVLIFVLLPAGMVLLPKPRSSAPEDDFGRPLTSFSARFVEGHKALIIGVAAALTAAIVLGCARLTVENSFIDYFKQSTEIYRGMKFIDQNLGGTTPLEIILDLKGEKAAAPAAPGAGGDKDFDLFGDIETEADPSKYWFTTSKLELIERVHDYLDGLPETGKVLSLATVWKQARELNEGRPLDDFAAALLFNSLEGRFKDLLVSPFASLPNDEARITVRIKDSEKSLRRDALIRKIRADLVEKAGLREDRFRLSGLMLLYNDLLQSLYASQIKTVAWTLIPLAFMFFVVFWSVSRTLVALVPSIISTTAALGFMGLAGIPLDMMTITVVAVALGMAVDNAMHYMHRFAHELELDGDYVATMHRCHGTVGNSMYYASLPIILGYSILVLSNFIPTVLFGLLVAVVMAICLASDLFFLPAIILVFKPFGPGKVAEAAKTPAREALSET